MKFGAFGKAAKLKLLHGSNGLAHQDRLPEMSTEMTQCLLSKEQFIQLYIEILAVSA